MARFLVTGGAGFIGSNLALNLDSGGHEVIAVDNFLTGSKENLANFHGEFIELDDSYRLSLDGDFDAVFHHGDITDPRFEPQNIIYDRNLASFQSVADFAARKKAKLIYASTAGLYGNGPVPMKEDQKKELLTEYGKSKLKMDELAAELAIPAVGLRYFNVFGPGEAYKNKAASMILHLARQMKAGKKPRLFRAGEQKRDFIYVKDVVKACLCALDASSGVCNVGTGKATSFNELIEVLNGALGTQLEIEYFDMPFDSATYQANTQADTRLAQEQLGFVAEWDLERAITDYVKVI